MAAEGIVAAPCWKRAVRRAAIEGRPSARSSAQEVGCGVRKRRCTRAMTLPGSRGSCSFVRVVDRALVRVSFAGRCRCQERLPLICRGPGLEQQAPNRRVKEACGGSDSCRTVRHVGRGVAVAQEPKSQEEAKSCGAARFICRRITLVDERRSYLSSQGSAGRVSSSTTWWMRQVLLGLTRDDDGHDYVTHLPAPPRPLALPSSTR